MELHDDDVVVPVRGRHRLTVIVLDRGAILASRSLDIIAVHQIARVVWSEQRQRGFGKPARSCLGYVGPADIGQLVQPAVRSRLVNLHELPGDNI